MEPGIPPITFLKGPELHNLSFSIYKYFLVLPSKARSPSLLQNKPSRVTEKKKKSIQMLLKGI